MPAAYFVVRATVTDPAKRRAFDQWYQRVHMPDAAKSFGVKKAWRSGAWPIPRSIRRPTNSTMKLPSIAR